MKLLGLLIFFCFQLYGAEDSITNATELYERLDREIKAKNKVRIESLLSHFLQKKLTANHGNNLLERALFFHAGEDMKDMAFFVLSKHTILKINRMGIHDILRISVSNAQRRIDVAKFALEIEVEGLKPDKAVIKRCLEIMTEKRDEDFIKLFSAYLSPSLSNSGTITEVKSSDCQKLEVIPLVEDQSLAPVELIESLPDATQSSPISTILTYLWNNIIKK